MGTRYTVLFIIFTVGFLSSCATQTDGQRGIEIDQEPMYGGIDRKADPQLNAADEQLISGVTKEFGSREKASDAFVEQGTWFYKQDNYAMAMKRFNQAWLLNQDNPGAYWGFAVVYHDKGKNCDAKSMIDRALVLHLSNSIHLSDAGRIYTLCAVSDASLSQEVKSQYFAKSDDLYRKASGESSNNDYVFGSWATALYWQGDYAGAWEKVAKQRALGGTPPGRSINLLRSKMPEPK